MNDAELGYAEALEDKAAQLISQAEGLSEAQRPSSPHCRRQRAWAALKTL